MSIWPMFGALAGLVGAVANVAQDDWLTAFWCLYASLWAVTCWLHEAERERL